MSEIAERWNQLIDQLEPTMTAEWVKSARDHGEQPWIRLVLLVDAHDLLCRLGPTEKIAMTMADLAQGNDERQREGWEVIAEHARTERVKVITAIVDEGPGLLPQDLHEYFERSIEPSQHFR
ncbi:MAG: hypothetical protein H6531_01535 [Actinobacteria bacterium]|nr:hypothetical protein [Dehalococcoidia bacterium]MCB0873080.1 hypothetical protein [Thermoleophilia bacterium]MCB9010278.1 hypothetical protein [Actinomycetota bacterium]MCB9010493.1 hypothetical protein [Actinomycetota bacterium]